jgi:S1-C subfamily serine protease
MARFPVFRGAWLAHGLMLAAIALCGVRATGAADGKAETRTKSAAIDDAQILRSIDAQAARLIEAGKTRPASELIGQLSRKSCDLRLPKPSAKALAADELYEQCRRSVLIMAGIYKCEKCGKNHASPATGFVLSESGAVVTNYHVVNAPKNITLVAMTAEGTVYPVKEVLAASAAYDVAIVQVDASGLAPAPIAPDARVGSDVFIISHPDGRFFTLSRGIVARYGTVVRDRHKVPMLQVTAEYAKGSSGGPVLSSAGSVVGMVSSTSSVYYTEDHGKQENLQMVFNQCVPAGQILELVRPK